jgi:transposase
VATSDKAVRTGALGVKIAHQLWLSYNTVHKATTIRKAIVAHSADFGGSLGGEVELGESYLGDRRKGKWGRGVVGKVLVFGILECEGWVYVEVLPNVRTETVLDLAVKKVFRGSIMYTDRFKIYNTLMFMWVQVLEEVDHEKRFSRGRVNINGLEGLRNQVKDRSMKHHGISSNNFPFTLKIWSSDTTTGTRISSPALLNTSVIWC